MFELIIILNFTSVYFLSSLLIKLKFRATTTLGEWGVLKNK